MEVFRPRLRNFVNDDVVSSYLQALRLPGETGNAEEVAYEIQTKLSVRSSVVPIDQYDIMNLPDERYIIFTVSTTGEGDIPESMKKFWNFLLRKSLASDALSGLNYSVFGLGDSSYEQFNAVGRKLDRRLQMLGAVSMNPLGLGDDQSPYGYLSALNVWVTSLTTHIKQAVGIQPSVFQNPEHDSYKIDILNDSSSESPTTGALNGREVHVCTVDANLRLTAAVWGQDVRHVKLRFAPAKDSPQPLYEVGNVALVRYRNPPELVSKALALVDEGSQRHNEKFTAASILSITLRGASRTSRLGSIEAVSLRSLLERHLDIGAVPKRSYFMALAPYATNPEEAAKLLELASDAGTDLYFDYCTKERKSYVEVLEEFRSCRPPLHVLLSAVQVIPARQYSIASSPALCPREIELCVAVSHRNTPYGRKRTGLCSGFISRLAVGDLVHVAIKPGSIRGTSLSSSVPLLAQSDLGPTAARAPLPRPVPNILVGPGTGVAPMRGLIQHEIARQAFNHSVAGDLSMPEAAASTPNTLLFFGCRKKERDHLFASDWALVNEHTNPFTPQAGYVHIPYVAQLQPGAVAVSTAFSQDQLVKVYVTHKIKEQGELVCQMLQQVLSYIIHYPFIHSSRRDGSNEIFAPLDLPLPVQGANVFVVGSSKRMPADVRKALCAALQEHAGLTPAESDGFLLKLVRAKKYIVEAW